MLAHAHPHGTHLVPPRERAPPGADRQGTLKAPGPAPALPESRRAPHRCSAEKPCRRPERARPCTTEPYAPAEPRRATFLRGAQSTPRTTGLMFVFGLTDR